MASSMHALTSHCVQNGGAFEGSKANVSVSNGKDSKIGNNSAKSAQTAKDSKQDSAEGLADTVQSRISAPSTNAVPGDEAVRPPPSSTALWDDSDAEVQEPLSESSTELDRESWQNKEMPISLDSSEQPSRQEDTELGIFRPDEL